LDGGVRVEVPRDWPSTVEEALAVQDRLRPLVDTAGPGPQVVSLAAGLDPAYSETTGQVAAAAVVLDAGTLGVVERAVVVAPAGFGYVPGLLAFREAPALLRALERLRTTPDLLVCDGQGVAHPRRFGLACHVGVLTGLPTVGVAKTPFVGTFPPPGRLRGAWSPVRLDGEVVGRALRTRTDVRPVFVSVGHRIDLDTACRHVLDLSPASGCRRRPGRPTARPAPPCGSPPGHAWPPAAARCG
jgi:deoxyribonuclease V